MAQTREPGAGVRPSLSERAFLQVVTDLARLCGWTVYHPWLSLRSPSGFPDLVLCRPPRLIFAELKSGRRRPTPSQTAWLDLLRACPAVEVYLWRPDDWDAIVTTLERPVLH